MSFYFSNIGHASNAESEILDMDTENILKTSPLLHGLNKILKPHILKMVWSLTLYRWLLMVQGVSCSHRGVINANERRLQVPRRS